MTGKHACELSFAGSRRSMKDDIDPNLTAANGFGEIRHEQAEGLFEMEEILKIEIRSGGDGDSKVLEQPIWIIGTENVNEAASLIMAEITDWRWVGCWW
jgi:hypothetical protein